MSKDLEPVFDSQNIPPNLNTEGTIDVIWPRDFGSDATSDNSPESIAKLIKQLNSQRDPRSPK